MSKAILVLEMPSCCVNCPCVHLFGDFCKLTHKDIKYNAKRPKWCPLREVPERKEYEHFMDCYGYKGGYNDCVDEILGGGE